VYAKPTLVLFSALGSGRAGKTGTLIMYVFSFDTETFLINPGCQAPPMVCLQYVISKGLAQAGPPQVVGAWEPQARQAIEWALAEARIVGHNVAFDLCVLAAKWPDLLPAIFRAYAENRVTDTGLRQMLADLAQGILDGVPGKPPFTYGLAETYERHTGQALDKTDPWRLRYGLLWGVPVDQWPEAAKEYARKDAIATDTAYWSQESRYRVCNWLEDEHNQARAAFWIALMSARGIRTDLAEVAAFDAESQAESEKDRRICEDLGLVRRDGTRNMKLAMARMVEVCKALGESPPLTDTGQKNLAELRQANPNATALDVWAKTEKGISLDEDSCLASGDEILEAFQRFGSLKTSLARIQRLYYGTRLPLQSRFRTLVETGRTSCQMGEVAPGESPPAWGFQLHNLPRKGLMRQCFIPRAG
jgi:hypothetical protein